MLDVTPQSRLTRPEPRDIYAAVRWLRHAGRTVYRAGAHHHMVDGRRLRTEVMMAMAREALR